jgi:hypothetical protein
MKISPFDACRASIRPTDLTRSACRLRAGEEFAQAVGQLDEIDGLLEN